MSIWRRKSQSSPEPQFPSNALLKKYFGRNQTGFVRFDVGLYRTRMYDELRRDFDTCLHFGPNHLMRAADYTGEGFEPVVIFQNGILSDWSRSVLEHHGLLPPAELLPTFEHELFVECVAYHASSTVRCDTWWEWIVTDNSISLQLKPDANSMGGNCPRRSLDELLRE